MITAALALTSVALANISVADAAAPSHPNDGLGRANHADKTIFPPNTKAKANAGATCPNGYVALTYDDGPGGYGTSQSDTMGPLVDALTANGLHATFFDVGNEEEANPAVVQKAIAAGMDFGDHTYWHVYNAANLWTTDHLKKDIGDTSLLHEWLGGRPEKWFRPPYDQWVSSAALPAGMTELTWTLDDHVYQGRTANQITDVYGLARNGDIVLSHVGYQSEVAAVPLIAAKLKAHGLCSGRIVPSSSPTTNAWGESFNATTGAW